MNSVYFNENGITSTEANFLANIAKELQQSATERLSNIKFYNTYVAVIGSNEKQLMSEGVNNVDFIQEDLNIISEMNSFCAWIREAIKEKENAYNTTKNIEFLDWIKTNNIIFEERPKCPEKIKSVSESDIINVWDINKRNHYLKLEAYAATFGKYIHPDGKISDARKNAHNAINKPICKEGSGRDTILYYMKESIDIEKVEKLFINLQSQHRTYEKELNKMKAEIKDSVNELTRKLNEQYQKDLDAYEEENRKFQTKWLSLRNTYNTWMTNELERISKLKIAIPDALKETFKNLKSISSK